MNYERIKLFDSEVYEMNEQQKEIATIKERVINVNLSDADCERILKKCGSHGLTIGELLESFIGDLVDGTYSNGSDERMFAEQYFDRCWFGIFPKVTLLKHLIDSGYDPESYLNALNELASSKKEKELLLKHPENADEDSKYIDEDIDFYEGKIRLMEEDWKPNHEPNMEEEVENINKWVKARHDLLGI